MSLAAVLRVNRFFLSPRMFFAERQSRFGLAGGLQTIFVADPSRHRRPSSLGHFPLALLAILFNNGIS